MTDTAKHTPTPWKVVKLHRDHYAIDYDGRTTDQLMITDTWGDEPFVEKANAAHIVKCVNAHDDLLRWKFEAMQLMSDLDLQAIGKEMDLKLGDNIALKILPYIRKLKGNAS